MALAFGLALAGMARAQTEITAANIRALAPLYLESRTDVGPNTLNGSGLVGFTGWGTGTVDADANESYRYLGPKNYGLILDLGGTYNVSHLQFWNGNKAGETTYGIKTANFRVSSDGKTWTSASYSTDADAGNTFDIGTGAAGFVGNQITYSGSPQGRYLWIQPTENYGNAVAISVSEVRVFGSLVGAYVEPTGDRLNIVSVTASSTAAGRVPERIINDSGMAGEGHDSGNTTVWMGAVSDGNPWVQFDLGSSKVVGAMKVWNYNELYAVSRGLRIVDVLVSDDPTFATSTTVLDNYELLPGASQAGYLPQIIDIENTFPGQYLRITTVGNDWQFPLASGSLANYGLAEVRLFEGTYTEPIPEPSTLALLGMAGLALVGARWMKRK